MSASFATVIYFTGIAGLFWLDRDKSLRTSKALWLPVVWLWIIGSRQVSLWLGLAPTVPTPQELLEGSPLDSVVFGLLLALALVVVWRRRDRVGPILKAAWPVILYFAYCLLSVSWSAYPDVSSKRWIKSLGDLAMVLVVATELDLSASLRRLFSRVGFLLLPASILLIKYYPALGRSYDSWTGMGENNGVAVSKNMLGMIAFVVTLGAFWQVLGLLRDKARPNRRRHLLAQFTLLGFGVWVLALSRSDTSFASFALGSALLLVSAMPMMARRPHAIHALVLVLVLAGGVAFLLGGEAYVARVMGRKANLTDRTVIWQGVLSEAARSPLVGVGFESFWLGDNLQRIWRALPAGMEVNESHDGYIEVYAQLGWIGVALIALILLISYRRAVAAFRHDPVIGSLLVAYVVALVIYNIAEAGFRMLDPAWLFLLLALVAAARVSAKVGASRGIENAAAGQDSSDPLAFAVGGLPSGRLGGNLGGT